MHRPALLAKVAALAVTMVAPAALLAARADTRPAPQHGAARAEAATSASAAPSFVSPDIPSRSGEAGPSSSVPDAAQAPAAQAASAAERIVWYFYKVKWGYQDEFLDLFRRNHLPVLKAQIPNRIVSVRTYVPTYHGDGRADWTFAVEITYRDAATLVGPSEDETIQRQLFPDRAKFLKEEQRRFEILEAHWDVPLNLLSSDGRR